MKKALLVLFLLSALIWVGLPDQDPTTGLAPLQTGYWIEDWNEDRPLQTPRLGAGYAVVGRHIYVLGGAASSEASDIMAGGEFTSVDLDGTLAPWQPTTTMTTKRVFAAAQVAGEFIYMIGGEKALNSKDLLSTIERAKILSDGSLGEWKLESEQMSTTRRAPVTFVLGNLMYVAGGYNGIFLSDVESAEILSDGSLGKWRNELVVSNVERYIHSKVRYLDRIFLLGGHSTKPGGAYNTVEWSFAGKNGFLQPWKPAPPMPTKRFLSTTVLHGNTLYLIGGRNSVSLTSVEKTTFNKKGFMTDQWEQETPLGIPREGAAVALVGNTLFIIGGGSQTMFYDSVDKAEIRPGQKLGYWITDHSQYLKIKKEKEKRNSVPQDAKAHVELGKMMLEAGNFEYAITEFTETLRLSPASEVGHYGLGIALDKIGKADEAVVHYQKTIEINPNQAFARYHLGNALFKQGKVDNSIIQLKEALRIQPDSPFVHNNLGFILLKQRKTNEALMHFREAIRHNPSYAKAHNNLGFAIGQQGEYEEAIVHFKEALKIYPDFAEAHNNLGLALAKLEDFDEAIKHFSRALELMPNFPEAKTNLDLILKKKGQS